MFTYPDRKATVKETRTFIALNIPRDRHSSRHDFASTGGPARLTLDDVHHKVLNPAFPPPPCPGGDRLETLLGRPLEVEVRDSVDKALKILKQKMSKEGILQEIKRRRYYEKPSVKRKRKMREARKRRRREAKRRVIR
jgi:small subunit ribosomal protein S21